jgi:hypothetical protein
MKVVKIRLNTSVPDVRLEKEPTYLSSNNYDIPLSYEILPITVHSRTKKNQKKVIRSEEFNLKRLKDIFVKENFCIQDLRNRTYFEQLKNN